MHQSGGAALGQWDNRNKPLTKAYRRLPFTAEADTVDAINQRRSVLSMRTITGSGHPSIRRCTHCRVRTLPTQTTAHQAAWAVPVSRACPSRNRTPSAQRASTLPPANCSV
jgi:hypothetical protein